MKKVLFRSKGLFSLEKEKMKKGGKSLDIFRVSEPSSVVILPFTKGGRIILERQYRPAIQKYVYELPAGHIEEGESKLHAAKREMQEETGYLPKYMKFLIEIFPSPGLTTEALYIYLAKGFLRSKRHLDKDEIIEIKELTLSKLLK